VPCPSTREVHANLCPAMRPSDDCVRISANCAALPRIRARVSCLPLDHATERVQALLAPLTNYERTRPDRPRFTLDTMRALLARLGDEARGSWRGVQVGGSKGKGTTAAYLEQIARANGLRTGVFASPHVSTILERVRIDGELIDEELLTACCRRVLEAGLGIEPAPSFFEVTTAAALLAFRRCGVELAILEVGLGGRLDATTAVPVDLGVVTGVELEHTELLGDTVEAIAAEKAFVFRPGGLGIHACAEPAAHVVESHAQQVGCRWLREGRSFSVVRRERSIEGVRFDVSVPGRAVHALAVRGDPPTHEDRALALASTAWSLLFPDRPLPARIDRPSLPGRFEVCELDGLTCVLDGAHTEDSMRCLGKALRARFPERGFVFLVGFARGKRWQEALATLDTGVAEFVCAQVPGTASEEPEMLAAWLRARGRGARALEPGEDPRTALVSSARARRAVAVVTGSFYLVGSIRP
jgi:dihydrofolate synthase/folylpolyglutamate synthase